MAAAVYIVWSAPEFSAITGAIAEEVKIGAVLSKEATASVTVCSEKLPGSSVATTVKV